MRKSDRIKLWVFLLIRALLIGAGIMAIYYFDIFNFFISLLTLGLTFLPELFEKRYRINFPSEFEIIIIIFLYASIYLGEVHAFYTLFWWWDIFLHTLSGVLVGFVGFYMVYLLNNQRKYTFHLTPIFVAIFAFCFSITLGALWEIFEFFMDVFGGFNMQKSGLLDTMSDLIVDTLGALFVSVLGYIYLKKDRRIFEKLQSALEYKIKLK